MLCRLHIQQLILLVAMVASPGVGRAATGFIDTPDSCMAVHSASGSAIHLQRIGKCEGKPGRAYVEVQPGESRELFVDGVSIGVRKVSPLEMVDITGVVDRAERDGKKLVLPDNKHAGPMRQSAEQTASYYNSESFQSQLRAEMDRVRGAAIGDQYQSYYKDTPSKQPAGQLASDERLYVFISSSMPASTVRKYVADVAKIKDPRVQIVLRGFIGGMDKIMPTVEYITSLLQIKPTCQMTPEKPCELHETNIIVDPLLFRRYKVDSVPSFVFARGLKVSNPDMSEGDTTNTSAGDFTLVSGDASLGYVVGKLSESAGAKSLEGFAKHLR